MIKLFIALLIVVAIVYLSALNWRNAVKAVFFILVVEGALRKWVLPQASELVYFLKDFVLLGAYINYFFFKKRQKSRLKNDTIKILVFLAGFWCLFQSFNPSLGSPIIGLLGLKAYLYYVPLMWIIPELFDSKEDFYKFLRSHLLLTIPVGILGIAQYLSPAESPINVYAGDQIEHIATFGVSDVVRVTGSFSYIGGYAAYLIVSFGLLISLLTTKQSRDWQIITLIEFFFVAVNSLMTGSRGVIFADVLFLLGYIGFMFLSKPVKTLKLVYRLLLLALVVSFPAYIWFNSAIDNFWLRTSSLNDMSGRVGSTFTEPFEKIQYKQLDGYGTGATQAGTPKLRQVLSLNPGEKISVGFESEMGRIILELGPLGFILWYGLRLSILVALFQCFRKLKTLYLRQLALSAFLIQGIQLVGQLVFNHTFAVYYWFLSAFILLLPRLENIENSRREQQLFQSQQNVSLPYFPGSPYR